MKNVNSVSRPFKLMIVWALVLGSCAKPEAEAPVEFKSVHDWFAIAVGETSVQMQLAITAPEMQRGLMERRDLSAGQGMLFVYPTGRQMGFWMRNTPLPLDIAYFTSNGVLREIYQLLPHDERIVRSHGDQMQYALEVRQGWLAEAGIQFGDQLDLTAVRQGLIERGFEPQSFKNLAESPH